MKKRGRAPIWCQNINLDTINIFKKFGSYTVVARL